MLEGVWFRVCGSQCMVLVVWFGVCGLGVWFGGGGFECMVGVYGLRCTG